MLTYSMEERGGLPLYEYLYQCIRRDILDGTLAAGERLPSKRALAEHLQISVITVENAYQQLEAEGFLYSRPRKGFFAAPVERLPAAPAAPPAVAPETPEPVWRLDLTSGQVDVSRFPVSVWARLTRQVLDQGGEALLTPVHRQGLLALRQAIARDLRDRKGMAVAPEQVVVGAGAEYLYLLLAQLLAGLSQDPPGLRQVRRRLPPGAPGRPGGGPGGAGGLRRRGAALVPLPPLPHGAGYPHRAAAGAAALGGGAERRGHRGRL